MISGDRGPDEIDRLLLIDETSPARHEGSPSAETKSSVDFAKVALAGELEKPVFAELPAAPTFDYAFPNISEEDVVKLIIEAEETKLCAWLEGILSNHDGRAAGRYGARRDMVCAIHVALNKRCRLAPAFRPGLIPLPAKIPASSVEAMIARDRQVIDLHWAYCRRHRRKVDSSKYRDMFAASTFDFDLAASFASEIWSSDVKAEALCINSRMRWELAMLRPKHCRDRLRYLARVQSRLETELMDSVLDRPQLQKHVEAWVQVYMTMGMLKSKSPSAVAELLAFVTGDERKDDSAVRRMCETVLKRVSKKRRDALELY